MMQSAGKRQQIDFLKRVGLHPLTLTPMRLRGEDCWGSGAYGALRGDRNHRGVDLVVEAGASILSPMDGVIVREALPYEDDAFYLGLLLVGSGAWLHCDLKIFYLEAFELKPICAGEVIGRAQDIGRKYEGITSHVHLEMRYRGELVDPTPFFKEMEGAG